MFAELPLDNRTVNKFRGLAPSLAFTQRLKRIRPLKRLNVSPLSIIL
jgi:hypothetical protein